MPSLVEFMSPLGCRRWCLALALAVALVACDPGEPDAGVGVTSGSDGGIVAYVAVCAQDAIRRIELLTTKDGVIGNSDDSKLWAIEAEEGPVDATRFHVRTFDIGATPPGFTEVVSLQGEINGDAEITLLVVSTRSEQSETFRPSSLTTDSIRAEETSKSESEFTSKAREECGQRDQGP
jgi:phage gp45-like